MDNLVRLAWRVPLFGKNVHLVSLLSPFAVLMSQKKSSFGNFFEQINTENQQQINSWRPKTSPKFSHPYGGQSEILPKFRKVLRNFQQQINSKSTEQSRNSTFFGTSTLQMVIIKDHVCMAIYIRSILRCHRSYIYWSGVKWRKVVWRNINLHIQTVTYRIYG